MTAETSTAPDTPAPAGRAARLLGLPAVRGHGRFITGNLVDSVGSGMLLPLGLLYFTTVRGLSAPAVGAAVTVGQLAALPAVLVTGRLMDRRGPRLPTVVANMVTAAGFLVFLLAHRPWQIACAYVLVQSGVNGYYTAQRTLVTRATPAGELRAWFAFTASLRNIGIGAGAALAAGALALYGTTALTGLLLTAAPLYVLAAACFARVPLTAPHDKEQPPGNDDGPRAGPEPVADGTRRYLLLVACALPFVLSQTMPAVLFALYATDVLHLAAWTASLLLILNTVLVSTLTTPLTAHVTPAQPRHALLLGYGVLVIAMLAFAAPVLSDTAVPAWPALLSATVLFTLAEIFCSPVLNELSVSLTPDAARGRRQSLYQLAWSAGNITAPVLFTCLLSVGGVVPWAFQGLACLLALPALLTLRPAPANPDESATRP
ncbi:MFS transporter [Streptomyces sp. NPDC057257]|uniref:MFS transporter n=1 Tax=Streptomyces sp. NPDC057257 TaxID=3346071 RepID=UPI003635D9C6